MKQVAERSTQPPQFSNLEQGKLPTEIAASKAGQAYKRTIRSHDGASIFYGLVLIDSLHSRLPRECRRPASMGACLNEMGDVMSDAALILPFALPPSAPAWLVSSVAWLTLVSEIAGVLAIAFRLARRYDKHSSKRVRGSVTGVAPPHIGLGQLALALGPWLWAVYSALRPITVLERMQHSAAWSARLQSTIAAYRYASALGHLTFPVFDVLQLPHLHRFGGTSPRSECRNANQDYVARP